MVPKCRRPPDVHEKATWVPGNILFTTSEVTVHQPPGPRHRDGNKTIPRTRVPLRNIHLGRQVGEAKLHLSLASMCVRE